MLSLPIAVFALRSTFLLPKLFGSIVDEATVYSPDNAESSDEAYDKDDEKKLHDNHVPVVLL